MRARASVNYYAVRAWTGGSKPRAWREVPTKERKLVSAMFRDSMRHVHEYWNDYRGLNRTVIEAARIHWNRARYDAHATLRNTTH